MRLCCKSSGKGDVEGYLCWVCRPERVCLLLQLFWVGFSRFVDFGVLSMWRKLLFSLTNLL